MGNKQKFIERVRYYCEDDSHGYSQANRWGPDFDCSSLMIQCANEAGYDVPTGWGNTATMAETFRKAGWSVVPFDGILSDCEPGCIALHQGNHTEAFVDWNTFGGAHIDENGDIVGLQSGDQTGNEISICPAYIPSYGWDYILIPPSDDGEATNEESSAVGTRYRVRTKEYGWHDYMCGLKDTGGSSDDFAGSAGCVIYGFEVEGYDYRIVRCDGSETINEQGNADIPICGIEIMGDVYYQAHWLGDPPGWGKWEHGSDDNGAGNDQYHPLDMIRVK